MADFEEERVAGGGEQTLQRSMSKTEEDACKGTEHKIDFGEFEPYVQAVRAVLNFDEAALRNLVSFAPRVLEDVWQGWPLLLHIYAEMWDLEGGADIYKALGGKMDVMTRDWALQSSHMHGVGGLRVCIVGGQTFLHALARRTGPSKLSREAFAEVCAAHPSADLADLNGHTPSHIYESLSLRGAEAEAAAVEEFDLVVQRMGAARQMLDLHIVPPADVSLDDVEIDEGIRCFQVPLSYCQHLKDAAAGVAVSIPNSMHRYGKIVTRPMEADVMSLVSALLPAADRESVERVHAFYLLYSPSVGQLSLDMHRDDSSYTINLCLAASEDMTGSALRFPVSGYCYQHASGRGIIHKGSLPHYVEPLTAGERENIIIWVTLHQ